MDKTIRDLARAHTEEALNSLVEILRSPKASESARIQAASVLLDRGWGKAVQQSESITCNVSYTDFLLRLAKEDEEVTELLS